jgi:antitoxin CptB
LEITLDAQARRLLWRCRRGMKELDLLLERFARRELPHAGPEGRRALAQLLELPDPMLVDYLLGQAIPPEPELAQLVLSIRTYPPIRPAELATASAAVVGPGPAA